MPSKPKTAIKGRQKTTEPKMAAYGSDTHAPANRTRTRRNAASNIIKTDRWTNIADGLIPFSYASGYGSGSSDVNVRDAVILCQKAYYNFSIFRNTIDLMTEFSSTKLYFKDGTAKSRDFFNSYWTRLGLGNLQDQFYREYFRSGNVFVFRHDGTIQSADLKKITQVFGNETKASKIRIPVKYSILNPADISANGSISFSNGVYYKILSDYELARLKNPKTQEEKDMLDTFSDEDKKKIAKGKGLVVVELPEDKVSAIFYKKQDYEPFAVPMGFPVLEDINTKAEMKKLDAAAMRTMQQCVLLITMGDEEEGPNPKHVEAMQSLFNNESIGRVLIADHTTEGNFLVPKVGELLDPKKYDVIDRDIQIGLNNVLIGSEKFANQSIKVKVFIERLKQARQTFIDSFLTPEIKRISQELGFRKYPTPVFDDIDLQDEVERMRLATRLIELNVLTPSEGIKSFETGRFPNEEDSLESQKKFKKHRDNELYIPLIGGAQKEDKGEGGRPPGKGGKKPAAKKTKPIGSGKQSKAATYSLKKVTENMILAGKCATKVEKELLKMHNIDELNATQKSVAEQISHVIVANEQVKDWTKVPVIQKYLESPVDRNPERIDEINEVAARHNLDPFMASIVYISPADE
jgi:hypothetical protein